MKAEELRIGNYVYASGEITKVTDVLEKGINYGIYDVYYDLEDLQPIELTEEILLKCGFEKHSTNPFWFRKKQICISLVGSIELISWGMQIFKIDLKVKHLHQLQNLYFALTNEELNVQL